MLQNPSDEISTMVTARRLIKMKGLIKVIIKSIKKIWNLFSKSKRKESVYQLLSEKT